MRSPVNRPCIDCAAVQRILHARKRPLQKFPWRVVVIPTTSKIVFVRVKPAPKSGCSWRRCRKKQVRVFRIFEISLGKKRKPFDLPTSPCPSGRRTWTSFLRRGRESPQAVGSSAWLAFCASDASQLRFFFGDLRFCAMGSFDFLFGTPNNDCANWRSFRGFPNLRQALFQAASESVLTAKSIFARLRRSLECTPQRRCGGMVDATDLKSVRANSSVWVRIPSSAPSERLF